jgi:hypothetical protein
LDLERFPYVDLSDVSLDSRIEKVIETILKWDWRNLNAIW